MTGVLDPVVLIALSRALSKGTDLSWWKGWPFLQLRRCGRLAGTFPITPSRRVRPETTQNLPNTAFVHTTMREGELVSVTKSFMHIEEMEMKPRG